MRISEPVARWIAALGELHSEVMAATTIMHGPRARQVDRDRWMARLDALRLEVDSLVPQASDHRHAIRTARQLLVENLISTLDISQFGLTSADLQALDAEANTFWAEVGTATMAGRTDVTELRRRCQALERTLQRGIEDDSDAPPHSRLSMLVRAIASEIEELARHPKRARAGK